MTIKDLKHEAAKIVMEAARLKPDEPGHTAQTQVFVGQIITLIEDVEQQAQEDDLTMLTGEKMPEPKGKHRKEGTY